VRASFGSVLIPLFEEDSLRMGEIARRARLSKQTMTTLVRLCEREGLVKRREDPADARAAVVSLAPKAKRFRAVAERVLAAMEDEAAAAVGPRRLAALRKSLEELA
jgi:DNA-binding MarR family transcriptional regulator